MNNTYEISTLADIYALPDAEAIERCLKELGAGLAQAKRLNAVVRASAKALDERAEVGFELSFPLIWTDDDKGDVSIGVEDMEGNEILRMEIKCAQKADA